MGIAVKRIIGLLWRFAQNRSGGTGKCDQFPGFHALQPGNSANIQVFALGGQINHLAADHARPPGRIGQGCDEAAPYFSIGMGLFITKNTKGKGKQAVPGENRRGLVELYVTGVLAAPQIVIVHGRQIIMNQRIGMHHFHGRGHAKGAVGRHIEEL